MNYDTLTSMSASQFRAKWPNSSGTTAPRYLFRGQSAFHVTASGSPSIISYFSRLPANAVLIGQVYTTFRYASKLCTGTWGYHVGHEDALGVLQHYGWHTPSIDFTATADVALAFALHPTPQTPVIYVLDRQRLTNDVMVSEHDFLISPGHNGLTSRWWRQDGFGLMNASWREADTTRNFNLYTAASAAIQPVAVFNDGTVPRSAYESLLDLSNDVHAMRVHDVVRLFCDQQFGPELHPQLRATIDEMCP